MGKIKQGILGGFNGTVGTVVGASWKGISYMRGKAQSIKKSNTARQAEQRSKFTLVANFLLRIKSITDIGFKNQAKGMSAFNAAFSYTIKNAITGTSPNFRIDTDNLLISRGNLEGVEGMAANYDSQIHAVVVTWTNNGGTGSAMNEDNSFGMLYNVDKREAITTINTSVRDDEELIIDVPDSWSDDEVHAYVGFTSTDGKRVSTSAHAVVG